MNNSLNVAELTLPDEIKLQLESLNDVNLASSRSGVYIDFDHDLFLDLEKFFTLHSKVPYMDVVLNRISGEIFGKNEIKIAAPKYKIYRSEQEISISIKGLLKKRSIELIFGKQPLLIYNLPKNFNLSYFTEGLPIVSDLKLSKAELIITNTAQKFIHSELGCIDLARGFNIIGNIDFKQSKINFSEFIYKKLRVPCLTTIINFNPAGTVNLTGNIFGDIQLFALQQFQAKFKNLLIGLNIGADLEPNFELTGKLILKGYDPTQEQEPQMLLSGSIALEPESLTAYFCQQGEKPWCNPYGLAGTELRNVRFQGGGTYLPPYFDNFGFVGDLKWGKTDLEVAFIIDTNDPEKLALVLNPRQAVSLIDLWRGPVTGFLAKQVGDSVDLVNKALGFLENLMNLTIAPIDGDGDGKLNSLIKYVPFPTTIASQPISEGLEINGKVNAWGHEAILILQCDKTFNNICGSLKVWEIDFGFLKIKGADDHSLDLALKVTPSEQYFQGDCYIEIFGNQIANIECKITSEQAIFKNFDLNLINLFTIDIDALSIDIKSGSASGSGKVAVLGNRLVGIAFNITHNSVNLQNFYLSLAGFLTCDIPQLSVDLNNKCAAGTANITAFNQSLGRGTLLFNSQNFFINDVAFNLANILQINIPSFKLDITKRKLFGWGDVFLLGKQFTALGISLSEDGFQATSNFNFGILAFNGATVTLGTGTNGNINNLAMITGNLKFLGYNFANITASLNNIQLMLSGSFNFAGIFILKGINNQKDATIMLNRTEDGRYNSLKIRGKFYLLERELTAINICRYHGILKVLGVRIVVKPSSADGIYRTSI